ncbi:MAG: hypothetical protein PVJ15_03555 [Gammaproteobacteria bacterium]|jgi:hypothetical protein
MDTLIGLLKWLLAFFLIAVLGYAAWHLYDYGKLQGADELQGLRTEYGVLKGVHARLMKETVGLRERLAILERSSQIDRQAAQQVQDELGVLQEELQAAREEVEFYRGIVSPGDVKPGLRIHRFTLSNGLRPRQYHYDLVLTQLKRNDRYVDGLVSLKIIGQQGEEASVLDLADVSAGDTGQLGFHFRYFQHLGGVITLPEGYRAQELVLSVKATGKKAPEPVEQRFAWPAAES